jgi:multicomponent Na+:H+ antiporter subunit G
MLRFRDVYSRLHASTKSATLGVFSILLSSFLFFLLEDGAVSGKLVLGIVFVLLTSPVSAHLISRAAYRSGVALWDKTVQDELKNHIEDVKVRRASEQKKNVD